MLTYIHKGSDRVFKRLPGKQSCDARCVLSGRADLNTITDIVVVPQQCTTNKQKGQIWKINIKNTRVKNIPRITNKGYILTSLTFSPQPVLPKYKSQTHKLTNIVKFASTALQNNPRARKHPSNVEVNPHSSGWALQRRLMMSHQAAAFDPNTNNESLQTARLHTNRTRPTYTNICHQTPLPVCRLHPHPHPQFEERCAMHYEYLTIS